MDPVTGFSRRTLLALALAAVLGVVAATVVTIDAARPDDACPDEIYGCATFKEGEPLVIGALFPTVDGPSVQAVRRAVALRGATLLGRPLEILAHGAGCSEEGGAAGARILATDAPDEPPVVGVVGGACPSATIPAAQILSDSGITLASVSHLEIPRTVRRPRYYLRSIDGGDAARLADLVIDAAELVAVPGEEGRLLVPRTPLRDALIAAGLRSG